MNKLIRAITGAILVAILSACGSTPKQEILIAYPSWAEGIAMTNLSKYILEQKGYKVDIKRLDPGPIYASLAKGEADVFMDAWLPFTHADYWEKYGTSIDTLGVAFDDGMTGLVVPSYVTINAITELNAYKSKFKSKIYGIGAGAGIVKSTENAIKEYKLDFTQVLSSETSMVAELRRAINNKEWVVITGWKPHYMWEQFEIKALADPRGVYPTDKITIVSRKGFDADHPEVAEFFKQFKLSEELLYELINDVNEDRDPMVGAKKFYEKHGDVLPKI